MAADASTKSNISQTIVFFILPAAILGFLALALFFDFLGTQASEIAKLVSDIEGSCKDALLGRLGMQPATGGIVSCAQYFPHIVLFFVLLGVWCFVANVVTLRLLETVQRLELRVLIAVTVAVMLPAILLYKYWSVIPLDLAAHGLFAAIVAIETIVLEVLFVHRALKQPEQPESSWLIASLFSISIVAFITISLLFAYYPLGLANYVGSINTLVLYLVLAYAFLGGLFFYGRQTGIPFAGLLLVWVLVIDALGVTHGNTVSFRAIASNPLKGDQQFLTWLGARRDRAAYATKEYPVYIVASAGGGIYAGVRSAYFLNFLQKECPAFAHHVFAISSVSGGGLGALAFASQLQSVEQRGPMPCETAAASDLANHLEPTPILDDFFSKDLLSTIAGAGLFPNMLQRVIPWPIPSFDRSQAFRRALGENWAEALKAAQHTRAVTRASPPPQGDCSVQNYFVKCEIAAYWDPAGDVPMLLFNATEVDSGSPVVLSNLDADFYTTSLARISSPTFENRSIYLIDGASLSARFPVALPAGFLPGFAGSKSIRLVDGGYFDATGLTMAQAIKTEIDDIARKQNLPVKVRIIFLGEKVPSIYALIEKDRQGGDPAIASGGQAFRGAELTAHITALLRARDQQSAQTVSQLFRPKTFRTEKDDPLGFQWDPYTVEAPGSPCPSIPLAWYLAPCTLKVLQGRLRNALEGSDDFTLLRDDLSPK